MLQLLAPCPHEIAVHQNFLDVLCRLLDARDLLTLLRRCYRIVSFRDGWPRAVLAISYDLREVFQGVRVMRHIGTRMLGVASFIENAPDCLGHACHISSKFFDFVHCRIGGLSPRKLLICFWSRENRSSSKFSIKLIAFIFQT